MKKIIFTLILFILFSTNTFAFDIDIDKISINSKTESLIANLDKSYNIDITGFNKEIINDTNIVEITKTLTSISLNDDSIEEKRQNINKYLYISENNGIETLTGNLFIETYLDKLEEYNIVSDYIKDIKVVSFLDTDALSFVYLKDATVNGKTKDVILSFWLKEKDNEYYIHYPWITLADDLNDYFTKISNSEEEGNIIGGTYNQLSLSDNSSSPDDNTLTNLYNQNKNSMVEITGMTDSGISTYGSGFFIRDGIIVTTWSIFQELMTDSNYIYVNDCNGNTYDILGIVAAQTDYDVVVLKISSNTGTAVTFGNTEDLSTDDKLFMINSKQNSTFSISYGTFISLENGRLKNLFLLNSSDVGSAIFDINGNVVGINVADSLNSELSYANSTDYLKELQTILNNQTYEDISYTIIETFKQTYYNTLEEEKEYNNVPEDTWNELSSIANLNETITLPLIKASYKDNILSLRYKNGTDNMIDSMYLISNYTSTLVEEGYSLTYDQNNKKIYKNNKYKIIIKTNLNYLIILIMEN